MPENLEIIKRSFDISLYEMNLHFNSDELKSYLSKIQMSKEETVLTTYYTDDNIILDPNLRFFKEFIFFHITIFSQKILNKDKFVIHNSWFQAYKKENYHNVHVHNCNENSYSLIFYIDATSDSSVTNFFIPGFPYTPAIMKSVIAEKNKLVFFPGYLPHQVPPNKDEQRIIFSANFEVSN